MMPSRAAGRAGRLGAIAVACALAAGVATPRVVAAAGLDDDVRQASAIIERFQSMPERQIPRKILDGAKGLAILTVVKAGFLVSAQGGKGVVIAKTSSDGWSGPSGIGTGGAGFGFQVGAQVTEFV